MGWSIRKSFKFGPVRISLSNKGVSGSVGVKGARVSFSKRGTFLNLGLNGLYYKSKLNLKTGDDKSKDTSPNDNTETIEVTLAEKLQNASRKKPLLFWLGILPSAAVLISVLIYLGKPIEVNKTYIPWVSILKNSVHVRASPSLHGKIIGYAKIGDQFRFIERTDNGWLKLWYDNSTEGYVNKDLGVIKPILASTEVIKPFHSTPRLRNAIAPAVCLLLIAYCFCIAVYDRRRRTVSHIKIRNCVDS